MESEFLTSETITKLQFFRDFGMDNIAQEYLISVFLVLFPQEEIKSKEDIIDIILKYGQVAYNYLCSSLIILPPLDK